MLYTFSASKINVALNSSDQLPSLIMCSYCINIIYNIYIIYNYIQRLEDKNIALGLEKQKENDS